MQWKCPDCYVDEDTTAAEYEGWQERFHSKFHGKKVQSLNFVKLVCQTLYLSSKTNRSRLGFIGILPAGARTMQSCLSGVLIILFMKRELHSRRDLTLWSDILLYKLAIIVECSRLEWLYCCLCQVVSVLINLSSDETSGVRFAIPNTVLSPSTPFSLFLILRK